MGSACAVATESLHRADMTTLSLRFVLYGPRLAVEKSNISGLLFLYTWLILPLPHVNFGESGFLLLTTTYPRCCRWR
jgi:hypothetical protein